MLSVTAERSRLVISNILQPPCNLPEALRRAENTKPSREADPQPLQDASCSTGALNQGDLWASRHTERRGTGSRSTAWYKPLSS